MRKTSKINRFLCFKQLIYSVLIKLNKILLLKKLYDSALKKHHQKKRKKNLENFHFRGLILSPNLLHFLELDNCYKLF